jgi:hypothetical protein
MTPSIGLFRGCTPDCRDPLAFWLYQFGVVEGIKSFCPRPAISPTHGYSSAAGLQEATMSFDQSLLLTIVDKLLIGLLLLIAGYWLNGAVERMKGRIALQNALAPARSAAYSKLWGHTQGLTPRGKLLPSAQDCEKAFIETRAWYYSEGGAMHLTHDATRLTLQLLTCLEQRDAEQAKAIASALRTQLKLDLGTYSKSEAKRPVQNAG